VKGTLKVRVESTTPAAPLAEAAPAEARPDLRTEKRGRRPEPAVAAKGEKPVRSDKAPKTEKAPKPAKTKAEKTE
jgi:hypothetical protein